MEAAILSVLWSPGKTESTLLSMVAQLATSVLASKGSDVWGTLEKSGTVA